MKTLLYLIIFCLVFFGCENGSNPVIPPTDDYLPFEIDFIQYSDTHYFIDEPYTDTSAELNIFNLFYGSHVPEFLPKYLIKDFQIFITINDVSQEYKAIEAHAYLDLPPRPSSVMYPDSLRSNYEYTPGQNEVAKFRLLNNGEDYIFHQETGYITFLIPVREMDVIAAAYRVENDNWQDNDDVFYGEFISELVNNSKKVGVLKLIKPRNLYHTFNFAWQLKMKNIYKISSLTGRIADLDLDIYLRKSDGTEINKINNKGFLELFGFDRYDDNHMKNPDGKFDYLPGLNFNPRTCEIIFPVLEPFGNNIPALLENYKYQAIYDTIKEYISIPDYSFIIRGKYKPI